MAKSQENISPGGYAGKRFDKKKAKGPYRRKKKPSGDMLFGVKEPEFRGELGDVIGGKGRLAEEARIKKHKAIEADIEKMMGSKKRKKK